MKPADALVLDTERPLLIEALKLCGSPDIKTLMAGLPAFAEKMKAVHVAPDHINEKFAAAGMVSFSGWGFSAGAPAALDMRSFFVEIRMQETGGRTVTFCEITDMTTDPDATKLALVEADWLKAIEPWTQNALKTLRSERPATATDDATFEHYFDLSTPGTVGSLSTFRIEHKLQLNFMRATGQ
ncbi:hypothetical protein [Azorhizobium oxalatiphilum]|nr:hypothetical protein [Azorhizobium oxalatiphilum]